MTGCPVSESKKVVTFDSNDVTPVDEQLVVDYAIELTDSTKPWHNMIGWYKSSDFTDDPWNFASDVVEEDMILYAKWESSVHRLFKANAIEKERFGLSVAVSGDTAIVGLSGDDANKGSAYIFTKSGGRWTEESKITATDGLKDDKFGYSVAIDGDDVIIGASGDDSSKGSAHIFTKTDGNWIEESKLTATDGVDGDNFGRSVSLDDETALVGAYWDNSKKGSAYTFIQSLGSWNQQTKLTAIDGEDGDLFGFSVAIDNNTAIVGAYFKDSQKGSAYIF